jgi:hypothetical protein
MNPHRIRLAGPWEWCNSSSQSPGDRQTCQLPFSSSADNGDHPGACGSLLLSRRFHCPTGIDSTTVVKIALEVQAGNAEAKLNGVPLEAEVEADDIQQDAKSIRIVRFSVSGALRPFNELQVFLSRAADGVAATLVSAYLEIHQ